MSTPASKLTASQVKLIEAEGDVLKQLQLLESNTCYQAIGVFALHGELETVGKLRQEHVKELGSRGHIKEFSANKEGKVVAVDRLLAGCVPKDASTAALWAWVEAFVTRWAQVEGGQAFINLAFTRVLLDRQKNGGSLEPHKLLVEEVHSNNVAALGTDELKAVNKYREGLLRVLEKKKEKDQADDGDVKELTADRPALPEVGSLVQTRSSDKEE